MGGSFLKRCVLAFAATDIFFTPGVCFCFLSLFHYPPGGVRHALLLTSGLGLVKLAVLLRSVARRAAPIEVWRRNRADGRESTPEEIAAAANAGYEAPLAIGKLWAAQWVLLLIALSVLTLWEQSRAGLPFTRGLPIALAFIPTVLLGAGTLSTILAGALFAPLAGKVSVEAHERGVPVTANQMSLRKQLALFAFGLCMAPTCWFVAFSGAMLLDADRANTSNLLLLAIFFVMPLVFGIVGAMGLSAMFSGSISGVADVLRQIAGSGGKLEGIGRVPIYFRNEFGDLAERANVMVDRLIEARRDLEAAHDQKLRSEKLASIGQLAATIGHELRNPLAAVRNAQEFVTRRLAKHPDVLAEPRIVQMLAVATREIDVCTRLISDLLDFARERELTLQPLPLHHVVAEAISLVPPRDTVTVTHDVPEDLPVPDIDKEQFRRMVINLVQNAVEAFPDGRCGQVRVEARHVVDKGWWLSVADDGPGIAPDVAARIFDPLFTTKVKGTGLGLAVVRNVAQRHGGTIQLDTEVGRGTEFRIEWGRSL